MDTASRSKSTLTSSGWWRNSSSNATLSLLAIVWGPSSFWDRVFLEDPRGGRLREAPEFTPPPRTITNPLL